MTIFRRGIYGMNGMPFHILTIPLIPFYRISKNVSISIYRISEKRHALYEYRHPEYD